MPVLLNAECVTLLPIGTNRGWGGLVDGSRRLAELRRRHLQSCHPPVLASLSSYEYVGPREEVGMSASFTRVLPFLRGDSGKVCIQARIGRAFAVMIGLKRVMR